MIIHQSMGPRQWFGWMVRDLEHDWKIGDREIWGRDMCIDLCEGVKNMKIFVSHMNTHQRVTSQRRILIIKWIG